MINPEFVERDGMQLEEEGCLSVPGFNATVVRPARAVVRGSIGTASEQTIEGTGLLARALSARDGSPRRPAVRRSAARHQARPHRPQDPEAEARRANGERTVRCASSSSARRRLRCRPSGGCSTRAHRVVGVVTQPDRPRGRGQHVAPTPTKALALARGVPVLQPERLRDEAFLRRDRRLDADLGVVAAYGKILPDSLLQMPRLGMINVHASLLPR